MTTWRRAARCGLIAGAVATFAPVAATAAAATYCVPAHGPTCSGIDRATIQAALQAAAFNNPGRGQPTHDTIRVAAGTYDGPFTDAANNPVTLLGAGDKTVLDDPSGGGSSSTTLTISDPASSVAALKVVAPPGNNQTVASSLASFTNVTIVGPAGNSGTLGLRLDGAAFNQGTISLDDSRSVGVATGNRTTIGDSRITAGSVGIRAAGDSLSAFDDLVRVTASGATAMSLSGVEDAHIAASQLTLIGPGTPSSTGVDVTGSGQVAGYGGGTGSASLDGVILRGFASDLFVHELQTSCGTPPHDYSCSFPASLSIAYSDFDPATSQRSTNNATITEGDGNLHGVDPLFAGPATGNFDLPHGSPVVDKGDPQAAFGGTDVLGRPRVVDGNGDKHSVVDMGAFEWQLPPPPVAVIRAPSSVLVGRPVRFDGASSHDPEGGQLSYLWTFGDGNQSTSVQPGHTYGKAGTFRVTLTVTSSSGAPSASASQSIAVTRPAVCVVPKLRGRTLAGARAALLRAHCRLGAVSHRRSSSIRRKRVISSKPKHGTQLPAGSRVALVISRGR